MSVRVRVFFLALAMLPLQFALSGARSEAGEASNGSVALLSALNRVRKGIGLPEIVEDPALSAGCEEHARYLLLNRDSPLLMGLALHTESPELPGYSERGLLAANGSLIAIGASPDNAISAWLAGVYHRTPLLRENLRRIGLASGGEYTLADVQGGVDGGAGALAICYPGARQCGVPTRAQREQPSPLPAGVREAGYPVTVQFHDDAELSRITAALTDETGASVPCYHSDPERPASSFPQGNVVAMIPNRPLRPGATYTASVECIAGGERRSLKWSFTTRAKTP